MPNAASFFIDAGAPYVVLFCGYLPEAKKSGRLSRSLGGCHPKQAEEAAAEEEELLLGCI